MLIPVVCHSCGFDFQVDAQFAGAQGRCPRPECSETFLVTAAIEGTELQLLQPDRPRLSAAKFGLPKRVYLPVAALLASLALLIVVAASVGEDGRESRAAEDASAQPAIADQKSTKDLFRKQIQPFLRKYCFKCHGPQEQAEGLEFHKFTDVASVLKARKTWEKVLGKIKFGVMPPEEHDRQPTNQERQRVVQWLEEKLYHVDCSKLRDPGRVTIRRLNRVEYNNTIRNLVGVDFEPGKGFPSDDVGYGFDNIGDVLSLPPLLMEKYLDAAEKIAEAAIIGDVEARRNQHFEDKNLDAGNGRRRDTGFVQLSTNGEVSARAKFPLDGQYVLRVRAAADQAGDEPAKMEFRIDGKQVQVFEIEGHRQPKIYEATIKIEKGSRTFSAAFINDYYNPKAENPRDRDRNLVVSFLEVKGPIYVEGEQDLPETHRRIVICRPGGDKSVRDCAVAIFRNFASRAFRRPATGEELARLADLVESALKQGDTFEQAVQVALQAVLVSPHFLFRVENDPQPHDPEAKHRIVDYELASRLSYFLWSSMPDDELFQLAEQRKLHRTDVLEQQVRRMLKDAKSGALVENFGGQWLNLRNLDNAAPDPKIFPTFNDKLRADMRRETKLFVEAVIREDRSILDFLDGDFTFLNARLAEHYGQPGIEGEEFRKVPLVGGRRAGVLTQASILTITSEPTRTKPVKRGKWVLENILGTPPPPPPPNVSELEETAQANPDSSLRKQLELHRKNPVCASCHNLMDPIGFGFENFDAIGRWRDQDGKFPIDASGELPGGAKFNSPIDLVRILKQRKSDFSRCLTEKLLTFALGRGLEFYDKCAVDRIVSALSSNESRFSTLVIEIVRSEPFLMRRGDEGDVE